MTSGNEWLVAFYRESNTWYGRLVPGEFKHVALLSFYPQTNSWIYLDLDFSGVHVFTVPATEEGMTPIAEALGACAVLRVSIIPRRFVMRGYMTCVSFVKHALGFNCWRAFTPDQLYDRLIDAGAEHLKS